MGQIYQLIQQVIKYLAKADKIDSRQYTLAKEKGSDDSFFAPNPLRANNSCSYPRRMKVPKADEMMQKTG